MAQPAELAKLAEPAEHAKFAELAQRELAIIIPTLGRASLTQTLLSLENQTRRNFTKIIVNDGPTDLAEVKTMFDAVILEGPRIGLAGAARNVGIRYAKNKFKWVAFLDDDDFFHPRYVEWFFEHVNSLTPHADVVIFRARGNFDHIPSHVAIPPPAAFKLQCGLFAISFAVKPGVEFDEKREAGEDFRFLQECLQKNMRMIISNKVAYGVRLLLGEPEQQEFPIVQL